MKNQTSQGVSYLLFAVLVVQGIDYSRFIGMWCNIDLKNWDSGYFIIRLLLLDKIINSFIFIKRIEISIKKL